MAESNKPRILFATIAAGGSHVSSAQAMAEAVEVHYPGVYRLELLDIMKAFGFEDFDKRHKDSWKRALKHPWSVVWAQKIIDCAPRVTLLFHRRMLRDFAREAAERLTADPPALIVANHGWLTVALTMSQRQFGLDVPVLTFETSTVNANALWADPDAERFMVGSSMSKARLEHFGIPAEKIDVLGYPVKQAFVTRPAKASARARLGLQDTFSCLVSLGGEGVGGSPKEIVRRLRSEADALQIIVITGRNAQLKERLTSLSQDDPLVRVEGFVDNMAEYVAASDVVIGKTGPATVYETLAAGRPVLAPYRSGGIENKMIRLLEKTQLGRYTPNLQALSQAVLELKREPGVLKRVETLSAQFDFPEMTHRLAAYIVHYARTRTPDASLCGRGLPVPSL